MKAYRGGLRVISALRVWHAKICGYWAREQDRRKTLEMIVVGREEKRVRRRLVESMYGFFGHYLLRLTRTF